MQISHPTMGSPHALVTPYGELLTTGSRSFNNLNAIGIVQLYNSEMGPAELDCSTLDVVSIAHAHHEIHNGHNYTITGSAEIDANREFNLCVGVPNGSRWPHVIWGANVKTEAIRKIYEGGTYSGGTTVVSMNRNRNAAIDSSLVFTQNAVISGETPTSGTLLSYAYLPASKTFGVISRGDEEYILKSGTCYLFVIKSLLNDNSMSAKLDWYEHTDVIQQF